MFTFFDFVETFPGKDRLISTFFEKQTERIYLPFLGNHCTFVNQHVVVGCIWIVNELK